MEIADYARTRCLEEIVVWLKEKHGLSVCRSTVASFLSWQRLYQQSVQLDKDQDTLKAILKGHKPKLSAIELDQYAEVLFKIKAVQELDAKTYIDVTSHRRKLDLEEIKIHQKDKEIAMAEKRLALQIKQAEEAEKITRTPMSDEEKMAQIRQLFNIGVDPEDA